MGVIIGQIALPSDCCQVVVPLLSLSYYPNAFDQCQYQILSRQSASLMMDAYIYCRSTSLIDKPIICQDAGEK